MLQGIAMGCVVGGFGGGALVFNFIQVASQSEVVEKMIQLWFLELHDSPLELKGELQYLDENCHFRGEKMTILV